MNQQKESKIKNYQTTIRKKVDRKKKIILEDSLLNRINEKGLSKKHNVKIVNKPEATSEVFVIRRVK